MHKSEFLTELTKTNPELSNTCLNNHYLFSTLNFNLLLVYLLNLCNNALLWQITITFRKKLL